MIIKRLSYVLSVILLAVTLFVPQQAFAEDVHAMTADELEVYISYLQVVLQNKRKEEGSLDVPEVVTPTPTQTPVADTVDVTFNGKVYTGTYHGEMQNDKPHGNGKFEGYNQQNKLVYTGQWQNGEIRGNGTVEADAFTLHFNVIEGVFDKTGSYSGDVVDGLPEGNGIFRTINSLNVPWYYDGEWKNGMFNGQGEQIWEGQSTACKGTFVNNEFSPTAAEAFAYIAQDEEFDIADKARNTINSWTSYFSGKQKSGDSPLNIRTTTIDINQYKKRPGDYGDKLVYVSNANVFQVLTWNVGDKSVECIMLQDRNNTIFYGLYYGKSNIVEGMQASGYVLPMDWGTYTGVDNSKIWAVFCAVSDYIEESYETLRRGDNSEDVWNMKIRMQELGYFSANAALSYSYNSTCEERVRQFQAANGLPVTGVADHDTLKVLYSNYAKRKP